MWMAKVSIAILVKVLLLLKLVPQINAATFNNSFSQNINHFITIIIAKSFDVFDLLVRYTRCLFSFLFTKNYYAMNIFDL